MKHKITVWAYILTFIAVMIPLSQVHSSEKTRYDSTTLHLKQSEFYIDSVEYRNPTSKTVEVQVSISNYNKKTEEPEVQAGVEILVGVAKSNYTVRPNETIYIDYAVSINEISPKQTYYNLMTILPIEEDLQNSDSKIQPYSHLFTIHVEDSESTYQNDFIELSDTKLVIEEIGIPYVTPTTIRYTYKNNSKYDFEPKGEIKIENDKRELIKSYLINSKGLTILPNEEITVVKHIKLWEVDPKLLNVKSVRSVIYNEVEDNYLLNEVTINLSETILALVIILVITALIIGTVCSQIIKSIKGRRTKSQESE